MQKKNHASLLVRGERLDNVVVSTVNITNLTPRFDTDLLRLFDVPPPR